MCGESCPKSTVIDNSKDASVTAKWDQMSDVYCAQYCFGSSLISFRVSLLWSRSLRCSLCIWPMDLGFITAGDVASHVTGCTAFERHNIGRWLETSAVCIVWSVKQYDSLNTRLGYHHLCTALAWSWQSAVKPGQSCRTSNLFASTPSHLMQESK